MREINREVFDTLTPEKKVLAQSVVDAEEALVKVCIDFENQPNYGSVCKEENDAFYAIYREPKDSCGYNDAVERHTKASKALGELLDEFDHRNNFNEKEDAVFDSLDAAKESLTEDEYNTVFS